MVKAISLLSGGLDSILATKLVMDQGIDVFAVNFLTIFCTCSRGCKNCLSSKSAADKLGIPLKVFEISKEFMEIVKKPKYGYGSGLNPCIDCRIFMFKKAGKYMEEKGAKFLITGEVLGERPMSQTKRALKIIEEETGLKGLILRPLSAKLLEPTIPEKEGWVDRDKFLAIEGRSRKPQIELAKKLGIDEYPQPAGGCLLTDPAFSNRMKDLMKYNPDFTLEDVKLLRLGRHFRLSPEAKLIVGRDEKENNQLSNLVKEEDVLFQPLNGRGPLGIGKGIFNEELIQLSSSIIARYCDENLNQVEILCKKGNSFKVLVNPAKEELILKLRI